MLNCAALHCPSLHYTTLQMVSVGGAVSSANQKKVQSTLAAMASRELIGAGQVSAFVCVCVCIYMCIHVCVCMCECM